MFFFGNLVEPRMLGSSNLSHGLIYLSEVSDLPQSFQVLFSLVHKQALYNQR